MAFTIEEGNTGPASELKKEIVDRRKKGRAAQRCDAIKLFAGKRPSFQSVADIFCDYGK